MNRSEFGKWVSLGGKKQLDWLVKYLPAGFKPSNTDHTEVTNAAGHWLDRMSEQERDAAIRNMKAAWSVKKSRLKKAKVNISVTVDKEVKQKLYSLTKEWRVSSAQAISEVVEGLWEENEKLRKSETRSKAYRVRAQAFRKETDKVAFFCPT
ncbi:MAG: hypothetical protein ACX931_16535 [Saccharospirillum sp.]